MEAEKKAGRNPCPLCASSTEMAEGCCVCLLSGSGGCAGRLRICLRDADVAADLILANLVDHNLFRQMSAGEVEENGLVEGAVLLLKALVLDDHGYIDLVLLLVNAFELHGDVADLLRFILASDGEFDIIALAKAAELVDFIMISGDERAELALGHFQVFLSGIEVSADRGDLGVNVLDVIRGGLGGQFRMDRGV